MKILGIIPSRYASTRFPGKPLALIHGKSMIYRVYHQALKAQCLTDLVVATDDRRIMESVQEFGGTVMMTRSSHPSGTDRCAEILQTVSKEYDAVINIQGDEPYIHPEQINLVADLFKNKKNQIGTLAKVIENTADVLNTNIPKVILDKNNKALYFSRSPIPYCKPPELEAWVHEGVFLKHVGIYGYRTDILPLLTKLPQKNLELAESLEQLRWLEHGYQINVAISDHVNIAVDEPADIIAIEKHFSDS